MRLGDLDDLKTHISELMLVYSGTELDNAILNAIDNATTVEYTFAEAFQKTVCDNKLYCPARPQGEWTNTSPYDDKGECSLCCYLSKKYYKFCPYCGAAMRGKDE